MVAGEGVMDNLITGAAGSDTLDGGVGNDALWPYGFSDDDDNDLFVIASVADLPLTQGSDSGTGSDTSRYTVAIGAFRLQAIVTEVEPDDDLAPMLLTFFT